MGQTWNIRFGPGGIALAALILLASCGAPPDSGSQALSADAAPSVASTRCPSPVGLEDSGPAATSDGLRTLGAIRRSARVEDLFALTDPALWPAVRQGPLPLPARDFAPTEVSAGPAATASIATAIRSRCGGRILEASWWIALCPDGSSACLGQRPAAATHLLFVRRHGTVLLWAIESGT